MEQEAAGLVRRMAEGDSQAFDRLMEFYYPKILRMAYLISGLKIGWARGWRAFISAEMVFGAVGEKGGIGWYILTQRTFMNTAGLFAGIILVIIVGMLVEDVLFGAIEKHTLEKWGMKA